MTELIVEIDHLSKRYGAVTAVDDLSFVVQRGEVCGLLGPNGAGKTTALRVLVGLVHPSHGHTRLFGTTVEPGMAALRRVGVLIEEAAFVPHLSGWTNLRLWWRSNGASLADADFDGALAVAGLGDAIHRKVKTYSAGMKQRLGIARVLLGRPDLLVLDEPTNGLDPGEIREIRQLVRRLADEGSTVLISSHHLAEVEQVCTRAVVMNRGQLVASGAVAELVGDITSVYVEVDDPVRARAVLASLPTVSGVRPEAAGFAVELAGGRRSDLVTALVGAGVRVETVAARRRLEDAFLALLGES